MMESDTFRVTGMEIVAGGSITIGGTGTETVILIGTETGTAISSAIQVAGQLLGGDERMKGAALRMQKAIVVRAFIIGLLALMSLFGAAAAANAQVTVGGHVGFVIPWVTRGAGTTTTIADRFQIGFPIGVTFKGQSPLALDLEMIPSIASNPQTVNLTIDPGVVWGFSHGVGVGMRMAFDVNSFQFGFIPLVNKSWDFKEPKGIFKRFFVEADFPFKFDRPPGVPGTNSFTFATHFGLGF